MTEPLLIAKIGRHRTRPAARAGQPPRLITGATGTGKTVTLQKLAESFSRIGVPVFMADVKGDLSGIAKAGALTRQDEGAAARSTACPSRSRAPAR